MDEPLILSENETYTYPQILDLVEQHEAVILTIQFADIDKLKAALAVRKSRRTRSLKDKDVPIEEAKLTYQQIGDVDKDGWVQLRIDLKSVQGIRVKGINFPGEF